MRGNHFNQWFGFTAFGESHGPAVGLVLEDVRPNVIFPLAEIQEALNKRKPGTDRYSSQRQEPDRIEVLSGVLNGLTTGMPICILVYNKDADSNAYENLKEIYRPGHADFSWFSKFKIYDYRGGGRASGRETIARVIAAGAVNTITSNISIVWRTQLIGQWQVSPTISEKNDARYGIPLSQIQSLENYLETIKEDKDSVGGIIEFIVRNVPIGLGDPVFEKLDANLAKGIISIGAIKAIEFGEGFLLGTTLGSMSNDEMNESGFITNHAGGILGGVSTGEEIRIRVAVKPTPSIEKTARTINKENKPVTIQVQGRHDICIVPRIIPVICAMIKLVLADAIAYQKLLHEEKQDLVDYRDAIDKIDEDILVALYRREQVVKKIAKYKKEEGLSIENLEREKEIYQRINNYISDLGLDSSYINKLWNLIIQHSKNIQ